MEPWYKAAVEVEIPAFIEHIKKLLIERHSLSLDRDAIVQRLYRGVDFFQRKDLSTDIIIQGTQEFYTLAKQLQEIENKIGEIDLETVYTLEAKLSDIGFVIRTPKGENSLKEITAGHEVYCLPWASMETEDKCIATPEDIWFFRMAREIFQANPNNIEFIRTAKKEE